LPAELIESELFGHERGAFTGAVSKQVGRFELADRGTIFLDEIGELPLRLQAKLLRVLQEGEFERLGSAKTIKVDVRVIAATNRNLSEAVQRGRFRSDLYFHSLQLRRGPLRWKTWSGFQAVLF
jgi:transcriptional regulator with GAF, ATPase, and Fis domain